MGFAAISGLIVLIYLPVAALTTLGLLAFWRKWHSPKLWQVILATVCIGLLPWLDFGSIEQGITGLRLGSALVAYVPVLIPAVLWALQRPGSNGEFSLVAQRAGSLLVGYIVLVVFVLPAMALSLAFLSSLNK